MQKEDILLKVEKMMESVEKIESIIDTIEEVLEQNKLLLKENKEIKELTLIFTKWYEGRVKKLGTRKSSKGTNKRVKQ